MANALLTTDKIADRALMAFSEATTFLKTVNRKYDDEFANKTAKIGDTLRVRVPQHTNVRTGRVATPTPLDTIVREVRIQEQMGFDIEFSTAELALDIEDFENTYLAQQIRDTVVTLESRLQIIAANSIPNYTGTPADPWTKLGYANLAKKYIEDNGGFKGTKMMLTNSSAETTIIPALQGLFNAQKQLDVQYEEGYMGRAAGFDWNSSTVVPTHTNGAGTGYEAGTVTAGSTLAVINGTGAVTKGTRFTIEGVVAAHPQTKLSLGYLRQFVVTEDYVGGAGNMSIYPALVVTGHEKNVMALPASGADITFFGAVGVEYGTSLAYTKDAFSFVTVDLPEYPDRPCSRRVFDGVSMRVAQGSDIINDVIMMRFDIMWGFGALRPEWACVVANDPSDLTPVA